MNISLFPLGFVQHFKFWLQSTNPALLFVFLVLISKLPGITTSPGANSTKLTWIGLAVYLVVTSLLYFLYLNLEFSFLQTLRPELNAQRFLQIRLNWVCSVINILATGAYLSYWLTKGWEGNVEGMVAMPIWFVVLILTGAFQAFEVGMILEGPWGGMLKVFSFVIGVPAVLGFIFVFEMIRELKK